MPQERADLSALHYPPSPSAAVAAKRPLENPGPPLFAQERRPQRAG